MNLHTAYSKLQTRFQKLLTQLNETSSDKEQAVIEIQRLAKQIIVEEKLLQDVKWTLDFYYDQILLVAYDGDVNVRKIRELIKDQDIELENLIVLTDWSSGVEIKVFNSDVVNDFVTNYKLKVDRSEVDRRIEVHQKAMDMLAKLKSN